MTKTKLTMSAANMPTYPSKFDTTQYVEKRVANDIYMFMGGCLDNKYALNINTKFWSAEEVVDEAMKQTKYYNVVTATMEEADERYTKLDWWEVIDEDTIETMCDDALFTSFDNYVQLYNLHELAG